MFHQKFGAADAAQPLSPDVAAGITKPLLAGASTVTVAEALVRDDFFIGWSSPPTAEASGAVLLTTNDFCRVSNQHLAIPRVRFPAPVGQAAMLERINWMWHAGWRPDRLEEQSRAHDAIDLMTGQIATGEVLDPETLAEDLSFLAEDHSDLVDALFTGDLDDVPSLIDTAVEHGADERELVILAARMFVCWGALEQQRQACLGWRLNHIPLDGVWGHDGDKPFTIGQLFRPKLQQFAFAQKVKKLFNDNASNGLERFDDKRTINQIERELQKIGLGWINRSTEQEVIALYGRGRIAALPERLEAYSRVAGGYDRDYRRLMTGKDGKSRAGQRADMLFARISAVHRTAITCARTCHLGALASTAGSTSDLSAMLDAQLPAVLRPVRDRRETPDKFRLRQLFHVIRLEFLRDGEHLPKARKKQPKAEQVAPRLDLDQSGRQRGHEIFDACWAELNDQPKDWRFITPFGWQCDGVPRVRFSKP